MTAEPASLEDTLDNSDRAPQNLTEVTFPIVGIAASAGGLEAFTQLLSHLPTDTGMGFVLVQHLAPDHESMLSEILGRTTEMPVNQVEDGVAVQPNHIYVIPPNTSMTLVDGLLKLAPRVKVLGHGYMPGDALFNSLAVDRGHKAIAVVLSGGDGDGSRGLTAIKEAGGVTFAQCEESAQCDSMPNTAVATGNVDFVLPPREIAEEIAKLSQHPFIAQPIAPILESNGSTSINALFALLRSISGVDFALYKRTTLDRRIERRMVLYKMEQLDDYVQYLRTHPAEIKALYEEILIHVTSFFRDSEAFDLLVQQVFPQITQATSADPIRIWVAGCSTGEEVYSIVICLLEFLKDKAIHRSIKIFATDISEAAINTARGGIYTPSQMVEVSRDRCNAFFIPLEHGSYQICKAVRELCVFARQDLSSDPPFSNLDLIACRNVLIYMGETLQKRLMPIFHYSLKSTGYLMLGTSESTGKFSYLFDLVDRKYKIYTKKPNAIRPLFSFGTSRYPAAKVEKPKPFNQAVTDGFDLQKETDQLIAAHYDPVGVVVNDKLEILQLRGDTSPYLQLAPGKASLNLLKTVREPLVADLKAAIHQAQQQNVTVRKGNILMEANLPSARVFLQVIPFQPASQESYFLILFEATPTEAASPALINADSEDAAEEMTRLRQALAAMTKEQIATQEYLQTLILEQEYVNQNLKVANEEILSSNEELQSTNEELETAKEEIQATNEELNTTNEELRSRNVDLYQANNDLNNLLASINIPILMLANDLHIRQFTPMAQRLFNLIPADAGRPVGDLRTNLNLPNLETLLLEVLETLAVKELEVQTQTGHWYTLRIRPYRTSENQIDGVVVVLLDIDGLKRGAADLEAARNYAEAIVETVEMPLIVLDDQLRVNSANRSFYQTFRVVPPETQQMLLVDLGNGQWNLPELRSLLADVFTNNAEIRDFEISHNFESIGQKTLLLNACKILHLNDTQMLLLAIEDITKQREFEAERSHLLAQEQTARQQAEAANHTKDEFLSNLSHELRNPLHIMLGWASLLRAHKLEEATANRALEVIERSAKAQAQLIEDLLDISRITSGKLHLNKQLMDLVEVVQGAIESVELSAEAKSIQLVRRITSVVVLGDRDRLQQVLWNLLTNAIKFTPVGGRVEITLETVQAHAEIRVEDTGQGIRAELLPYVFDRFRQGDSSTTKSTQGLGLGLSIVRHIVESHGGTVQANSPGKDQGTTMIVRLPLGVTRPIVPAMLPPANRSEPTDNSGLIDETLPKAPSLAGLRILVVDDEADCRDLLKWMLEDLAAVVVTVASAKAAIAALRDPSTQFDVLLSDIGMPDEDGLSLIRQVRSMDAATVAQIPAAAVTAYANDHECQLAIAAGFQVHIAKPIEPLELATIIAALAKQDTKER